MTVGKGEGVRGITESSLRVVQKKQGMNIRI